MVFISDGSPPFVISKITDYFWKQTGSLLCINEVGFVFRESFSKIRIQLLKDIFC